MATDSHDSGAHRVPSTGRTGVTMAILVIVLLALLFYFYWRGTGAREQNGERPAPVQTP